jgi:syntaxin 16
LQATQELRFRTLFNEEETQKLSKSIKKISNQLKQDLKKVEKNIRIYVNEELLEVGGENDLQSQLKNNMSQNILTELNSFSKKFKYNQEIYSQKCKELVLEEDDNILEMNDLSTNNYDFNENVNENDPGQNFLMKDESDQILQNRDNELNDIVYRVNNLQELFKDLNVIVIEQGSILDRIDYNIDIGFNNISKGKQKIISANEHHKSSCFRNVILFLLMCIFVESLLILFKFL